ncbi:MAG: hypothetical protein M4579_006084 [Chaenotheca gracillima]|nr:MAG: hypothetical protein M4579_006084 [Chaenotheca gracillima]
MHSKASIPIRVLTHNIRYATGAPFKGEEPWDIRCPRLCSELVFNTRAYPEAFICLQEVLHRQMVDIDSALNDAAESRSGWTSIGVGRDDGKKAGEYSPIFYRPSIWDLEKSKNVWLSKTPSVPSKDWDAASTRILTIGVFKHKQSGMRVVAMSTHLDDQGPKSRYNAAKIILSEIDELCSSSSGDKDCLPVFLAGDFNSEEHEEAYQLLSRPSSSVQDLRDLFPREVQYGNLNTFTGFKESDRKKRIDFLFLGKRDKRSSLRLEALTYGVLSNRFDDGVYLSDHRAVMSDLSLSRG